VFKYHLVFDFPLPALPPSLPPSLLTYLRLDRDRMVVTHTTAATMQILKRRMPEMRW